MGFEHEQIRMDERGGPYLNNFRRRGSHRKAMSVWRSMVQLETKLGISDGIICVTGEYSMALEAYRKNALSRRSAMGNYRNSHRHIKGRPRAIAYDESREGYHPIAENSDRKVRQTSKRDNSCFQMEEINSSTTDRTGKEHEPNRDIALGG